MERKEGNLKKNKTKWLFIGIGILFLLLGGLFSTVWKGFLYSEGIWTVCFGIGIIFITTIIIEGFLIEEYRDEVGKVTEERLKEFSDKAQRAIGLQLNMLIELLRNAEYCGVINILPPRRDSTTNPYTKDEQSQLSISIIRDSLTSTNTVKIFCISGREFLWPREKAGLYDVFLQKAREDADYKIQILLADPNGFGAKIRGTKEKPRDPSYIERDVETSRREKKELVEEYQGSGRWSLELRYYNFIPQAWFVITDKEMFLEPYHMADTEHLKKLFKDKFPDTDPCCGGRVPIFVIRKGSTLYEAMNNYFDWLWIHNDQRIFKDEFKAYFNVIDEFTTADNTV